MRSLEAHMAQVRWSRSRPWRVREGGGNVRSDTAEITEDTGDPLETRILADSDGNTDAVIGAGGNELVIELARSGTAEQKRQAASALAGEGGIELLIDFVRSGTAE